IDSAWYMPVPGHPWRRTYIIEHWSRERLNKYLGRVDLGRPKWEGWRDASRLWARDMLDAGVPPWLIKSVVAGRRPRRTAGLMSVGAIRAPPDPPPVRSY